MENFNNDEMKRVENEFGFIRQSVHTMGNNDCEFSRLDGLFAEYMDGKLTADEAIAEARGVQAGKIDR